MKRAVIVGAALLCFAILGASQTPKNKRVPKQHSTLDAAPQSKTEKKQQDAATPPSQTIAIYDQPTPTDHNGTNKQSQDATDVERQLTKFTGYLVLVGIVQCVILLGQGILFFQQKKIMGEHKVSLVQLASAARDNATAIQTQGGIMDKQLASMNGQIAAIKSQNTTMQEWVAVARDSAEAGLEKERARIKIAVEDIIVQISLGTAVCHLENYGVTPAFISDFRARLLFCDQKNITPDYSLCRQILYAESLQPHARTSKSFLVQLEPVNYTLTEDDVMRVRKDEAFVHFYGFVKYRDVFKRDRGATIHMRWTMRWGGTRPGMIMQWWEPVGLPEENADE